MQSLLNHDNWIMIMVHGLNTNLLPIRWLLSEFIDIKCCFVPDQHQLILFGLIACRIHSSADSSLQISVVLTFHMMYISISISAHYYRFWLIDSRLNLNFFQRARIFFTCAIVFKSNGIFSFYFIEIQIPRNERERTRWTRELKIDNRNN